MATKPLCAIPDCNNPHFGRGWCENHYKRWRRHGDPLGGQPIRLPAMDQICSVAECEAPVKQKGLCSSHFARLRRYGDPLGGGNSRGEPLRWLNDTALPFTGTECLPWPFGKSGDGYARIWIGEAKFQAHRVVCEHVNGAPPTQLHEAAHSCGNGHLGCVNPNHLSWKTRSENELDKARHRKTA